MLVLYYSIGIAKTDYNTPSIYGSIVDANNDGRQLFRFLCLEPRRRHEAPIDYYFWIGWTTTYFTEDLGLQCSNEKPDPRPFCD
jgi:hypothetical protein